MLNGVVLSSLHFSVRLSVHFLRSVPWAILRSWFEHGILREEFLYQVVFVHQGWGGALGRDCGGEGQNGGFPFSGDLGVGLEGQGDSQLRASSRHVREGRQGHGLVHGGQHPHHALWMVVGCGLVLVIMVMVVVLMLVQVSVLVVMVQSDLVVVLVGVCAICMLVVVVMFGRVAAVVMCLGVVSVHVVVAVPVVVGVVMSVPVGAAHIMVVRVVVVAVVSMLVGFIVMRVALGVVVDMVVCVCLVGSVCVVMVVCVCLCVVVAVVSLSTQKVKFLLPLSSLENTQR